MDLTPAPLFEELPGVPPGGKAHWVKTSDDVQIRVAHWCPEGTVRGTVLLFPGRTEYIEKYGVTADELARRGYATVIIDWRGQGLADRLTDDIRLGHVLHFPDYQKDIAAAMGLVRQLDLPRPYHLIGHSMGGGIGLRAVLEGLPVQSCAFTGPMWGIYMSPALKPIGWALSHVAPMIGLGTRLPPSTKYESYVLAQPFEDNVLTTDPDMYTMMQEHMMTRPELGIGGPTLVWLRESLTECKNLASHPSPDIPCVTFLGSDERIIDCDAVRRRMDSWPRGRLDVVDGAQHEVLMETPDIRGPVFDRLEALFASGPDRTSETAASG